MGKIKKTAKNDEEGHLVLIADVETIIINRVSLQWNLRLELSKKVRKKPLIKKCPLFGDYFGRVCYKGEITCVRYLACPPFGVSVNYRYHKHLTHFTHFSIRSYWYEITYLS